MLSNTPGGGQFLSERRFFRHRQVIVLPDVARAGIEHHDTAVTPMDLGSGKMPVDQPLPDPFPNSQGLGSPGIARRWDGHSAGKGAIAVPDDPGGGTTTSQLAAATAAIRRQRCSGSLPRTVVKRRFVGRGLRHGPCASGSSGLRRGGGAKRVELLEVKVGFPRGSSRGQPFGGG